MHWEHRSRGSVCYYGKLLNDQHFILSLYSSPYIIFIIHINQSHVLSGLYLKLLVYISGLIGIKK